jgi:hypothetical protein
VSLQKTTYGKAASKATLSTSLRTTIQDAYRVMGRDLPDKSNPHTSRWFQHHGKKLHVSIQQIVKAGTWTSMQTFATYSGWIFASSLAQQDNTMFYNAHKNA